jgi:hypothetical protein
MMTKEASWVAVMLAALLILMALMSPPGSGQGPPMLETVDRPQVTLRRVPLVGSILSQVERRVTILTWQLERIPTE